jgi:hypothetical protein
MSCLKIIRNEKGVAMLLAVSMIGLLSVVGIWMLLQGRNSVRVTSSLERRESVFHLAEGGLRIALRCLVDCTPSPSYSNLSLPSPQDKILAYNDSGMPSYMQVPTSANVGRAYMTSGIMYVGYSPVPAPGWMLNSQGSTAYHSIYYNALGTGRIPLPAASGGSSQSQVSEFIVKVSR